MKANRAKRSELYTKLEVLRSRSQALFLLVTALASIAEARLQESGFVKREDFGGEADRGILGV